MREVLFATGNPSKAKIYTESLKSKNIKVITIKDLDFKLDVDENGKDALENAYIKAKAYYDVTGLVTIGLDDNLFIEGIPEDKQPGTHVRRINGKELDDEEMINYYTNLVKEYGKDGHLMAKWVYGMVIYNGESRKEYTWSKDNFYFIEKPSEKKNIGYPLDSITIVPKYRKYLSELSEEELQDRRASYNQDNVTKFLIENIE